MICITLLFFLIVCANASHENITKTSTEAENKVVILQDRFIVEWEVNHTSQSVQFKASVVMDNKGWFLLGFMLPANSSVNNTKPTKPATIQDTRGDFVVSWPLSESDSDRKTLDCNTMKMPGNLTEDDNPDPDYQVEVLPPENNSSNKSVFQITRKLDTGDQQDVVLTKDVTLWIFGAYGNSDKYFTQLGEFAEDIGDTLNVADFKLMEKKTNTTDEKKDLPHLFVEQVKKHWMSVVMGVSAVVTLMIVVLVYFCFRKGGINKRKTVTKSFYKEANNEDDEARVAFLHSRT